ncbi:MAG: maleylpyruvate isomerase N-terminal domain-containing protein [Acidimicrobiales bacterium]|nr:maleylpyruvate isomerase N-terminal domain-containing protein [Acidimicrobiales bacterium]
MNDAEAVEWIKQDATEMAALLRAADPTVTVPTCPEWTAADLGSHIAGGFAGWYCYNASTPAAEWSLEGLMDAFASAGANVDDHLGNVELLESSVERFLEIVTGPGRELPTWCFGGREPAHWWLRRAGSELTVHLTDAAAVHGRWSSTSPADSCEAIDEVTGEIFSRFPAILATMGAMRGEDPAEAPALPVDPVALVASDGDRAWTLRRGEDGNAIQERAAANDAAAVATATSADLLAWLHGRPTRAPLDVEGPRELVEQWNLHARVASAAS